MISNYLRLIDEEPVVVELLDDFFNEVWSIDLFIQVAQSFRFKACFQRRCGSFQFVMGAVCIKKNKRDVEAFPSMGEVRAVSQL